MNVSPASLGVKSKHHEHHLKFVPWQEKGNSAYSGGWICNVCRKNYGSNVENFNCSQCQYDLCDDCIYNENKGNL